MIFGGKDLDKNLLKIIDQIKKSERTEKINELRKDIKHCIESLIDTKIELENSLNVHKSDISDIVKKSEKDTSLMMQGFFYKLDDKFNSIEKTLLLYVQMIKERDNLIQRYKIAEDRFDYLIKNHPLFSDIKINKEMSLFDKVKEVDQFFFNKKTNDE